MAQTCHHCGAVGEDVLPITDDRGDPETGYVEELELCAECARLWFNDPALDDEGPAVDVVEAAAAYL